MYDISLGKNSNKGNYPFKNSEPAPCHDNVIWLSALPFIWNALFFHPHKLVFLMFPLHFYLAAPAIFGRAAVKLPATASQIHGKAYRVKECRFSVQYIFEVSLIIMGKMLHPHPVIHICKCCKKYNYNNIF